MREIFLEPKVVQCHICGKMSCAFGAYQSKRNKAYCHSCKNRFELNKKTGNLDLILPIKD